MSFARSLKWHQLTNGKLIEAAEQAGFEVMLTTDKNIRYQQNLVHRRIAIVVLGNQQWPVLRSHMAQVAEAIDQSLPGTYIEVPMATD